MTRLMSFWQQPTVAANNAVQAGFRDGEGPESLVDAGEEGFALGFDAIGVSGLDLGTDEEHLQAWLALGRHGEMQYMARHGRKRSRPAELLPGTVRVIAVRWFVQNAVIYGVGFQRLALSSAFTERTRLKS